MADQGALFSVSSPDPYVARCVAVLHAVPSWPADEEGDIELIDRIRERYPEINVLSELVKWSTWMAEKGKEVTAHGGANRLWNWFSRSRSFRVAGRAAATQRSREAAGRVRLGGCASSAEDFAGQTSGLAAW